jgi:toxin HigB-1
VIKSFADRRTAQVYVGTVAKGIAPNLASRARRKLQNLDSATAPSDLAVPPGNRLEQLKGDRLGAWSIRVNEQWRICFHWRDGHAYDVELTDYH